MWICERELNALSRLWRELVEIPAARPDEAMFHCLKELTRIIGACNAFWIGGKREPSYDPRDPLRGWRSRRLLTLYSSDETNRRQARIFKQFSRAEVDPQTRAMVARAGETRCHLRAELVDDEEWSRSWMYDEVLRPMRIEDRIVGAHALDPSTESFIGLDRSRTDQPFGDRERDLMRVFLHGSSTFHREQALVRGLIGPHDGLTPREQDVLRLALTDRTEREIGLALGLTTNTVHQYIVAVCRKLGVKGRLGLMAHWLRHEVPDAYDASDDLKGRTARFTNE